MALIRPKDLTEDDLALYFKSSMIRLVPPEGKPEWVYLDSCHGSLITFRRGQNAASTFTMVKKDFHKCAIDVTFPTGYFNTKESVVFGERVGARQNMKGIHAPHNYYFTPMEDLVEMAGLTKACTTKVGEGLLLSGKKIKAGPELANFLFEEQKYLKLEEAFAQLRGKKAFARALSNEFALVQHHEAKSDYLIFLRNFPVAELLSKTKVRVLIPSFRHEIAEFFGAQGATILAEQVKKP